MKNIKPFIIGFLGVAIGALIAIYLGEAEPPDGIHLIGLFIGAISLFYLVIVSAIRFTIYMLKMLGYGPRD